ncbi:MAG: hypothetical protein ACK4MQ_05020 [Hyphomonas sp.]
MGLHIRDLRQSEAAGLSRLCETEHLLGALPAPEAETRILAGLREDRIAGAIWLNLEGETGVIRAILVTDNAGWQSDVLELIAEASLWLTSRGTARIEFKAILQDKDLLAGLLDMHFKADARASVMRRLTPARSAA